MGFYIRISGVTNVQKSGGPVAIAAADPIPVTVSVVQITQNVQHPFAAALLIDYMLSREGQQRMGEINARFGPRGDVQYPDQHLLAGINLFHVNPDMLKAGGAQAQRQYKDLFGGR